LRGAVPAVDSATPSKPDYRLGMDWLRQQGGEQNSGLHTLLLSQDLLDWRSTKVDRETEAVFM
jgi:hypothetical protein